MIAYRTEIEFAREMDARDPLAGYRQRFHIPKTKHGRECIYLCGNSLGLQPKGVEEAVRQELEDWKTMAVEGHFHAKNPWMPYHEFLTDQLARLVGAQPIEVVAMNSLTVNLHLMMVSFYRPTAGRHKIVIEANAFPSDRYAVESQIRFHGFDPADSLVELRPRDGEPSLRTEDIERLIERDGKSVALILIGGVNYYTGQFFELERIARAGHAQGCTVGFDLAHAAGNVPLKLHDWDADFACWCSYKYLNSGPGSVAGCFVHERHANAFDLPRFSGWWGHDKATRFQMGPDFQPIPGAEGWQISNPPILSLAAVKASLEMFDEVGMGRLREKSLALTGYLEFLLDALAPDAFTVLTPRDPRQRGCQLSLAMKQRGRDTFEALSASGIVCDWREPDCIRIAPVPFYNSFSDVHQCVETIALQLGQGPRLSRAPYVRTRAIHIVGGGLVGSLAAIYLARRGFNVAVRERRPDMRRVEISAGRSINLAVTSRGLKALEEVGLQQAVLDMALPMKGRMLHALDGGTLFVPYGQRDNEVIHSVSRGSLNKLLLETAAGCEQVEFAFNRRCVDVDLTTSTLSYIDESGRHETETAGAVLGTDGAGSAIRRAMLENLRHFNYSQEFLEHGYKELEIPPAPGGGFRMDNGALHIWPRKRYMLIALPNLDGSFTCTLFFPHEGAESFAALQSESEVVSFFTRVFPDAVPLMPTLAQDFFSNPTGSMMTVKCRPWHVEHKIMLLGDAAHAIVPFFGQGMNCGFEDCVALGELLDRKEDWSWDTLFAELESRRKPNADAIADMAVENFIEMRDTVADPSFQLKKQIGFELERRYPSQFIPRYSMVVFHPEISYAEARRRSQRQDKILEELSIGVASLEQVRWEKADQLVRQLASG